MIMLLLLIKWQHELMFDMEMILWKKAEHLYQVKKTSFLCNSIFFCQTGNYNEQLRVIDFPVYVSGKNDPNLTPLVPVN
jgi:hypothetical protein